MKLTSTQKDLSTNLSLVAKAVPSRPTHPILANVKLIGDADTQTVSLTAFDLSLGIHSTFSASVATSGQVTLPAKLLNDIISRLPEGEITIETDDGEFLATIASISGNYQIRGMGTDEYPDLPAIGNDRKTYFPIAALFDGLRGTLFATSPDDTKQILTGVHLKVRGGTLEFAATDGHRLAVVESRIAGSGEEESAEENTQPAEIFQVTVPAKALREVERMLGSSESLNASRSDRDSEAKNQICLQQEPGQVVFELEKQRLTSRTLDGQYPNYQQLIPQQFEREVILERKKLVSALERISVLADQKNNLVKFSIDSENQKLFLSVEAADVGSGKESLDSQISGSSIDVAFNVKYLLDGLKCIVGDQLQMQLNGALNPIIFRPLGGFKMTYLVMPVEIRS
ncbi:DNA polymerase III subunit beta [Merismopedia glauca]|uniref:Beta sliding clamp n=1 Tax=Merismopedia glauca CCAP 1448/3 TaxID=1296344 RepID=A0A2T1C0L1_9CYAN|nr:DNA polymerase III subunit beta [Merismopedia glauca]PSB01806.1 DNA polymerase III subunit beta [Merismopedia glauca CCAP 1448/3]